MNPPARQSGFRTDIGVIHFVGIGGIGMSGIAEVMKNLGFAVQGSDAAEGYVVEGLRAKGIKVFIGQDGDNVAEAAVVVTSTAIRRDNPEVVAAMAKRIPIVRRAEMLAELMRLKSCVAVAGTHGKTTTTSMVAALLDAGGLDPTVINGGIINTYGSNARLGEGEWMVVEADESDGSFLRLGGTIGIVTNIDPEHLDHWGDFDKVREGFRQFVNHVPFYGAGVLCIDHPEVQALLPKVQDRRIITYGFSATADVRGEDVTPVPGGNTFAVTVRLRDTERRIEDLMLPMPGRHNVQNALAAVAVAVELGIDDAAIRLGFARFGGVKRRFTNVGETGGVTIIDDYGHHPVEIKAVLAAAREGVAKDSGGRVLAVVQPHRFTRLRDLMGEFQAAFNDADAVYVAPVYAAGEAAIDGVDAQALVTGLRNSGHRHAATVTGAADLAAQLAVDARAGDIVVCLGAGDITKWAAGLAPAIQSARGV